MDGRDLSIKGNFITDSKKTTHDERQTHTHDDSNKQQTRQL